MSGAGPEKSFGIRSHFIGKGGVDVLRHCVLIPAGKICPEEELVTAHDLDDPLQDAGIMHMRVKPQPLERFFEGAFILKVLGNPRSFGAGAIEAPDE